MNKIKTFTLTTVVGLSLLMSGCSDSDGYSTSKIDLEEKGNTEIPPVIGPPAPAPDPYRSAGWFARTEVKAIDSNGVVYEHKTAGVFGALVQSSDVQDQHDIPGYGAALFQVIFLPDFSTDTTAGYFSEYKKFDENSVNNKKVWTFQIKNQNSVNLSGEKIVIDLEGAYNVKYRDDRGRVEYEESTDINTTILDRLTLIDVDNQTSYGASELSGLDLRMNDADGNPVHTRTFRWVLGSVDASDYVALPAPQRAAGRVASSDFEEEETSKKRGKFGLPPQ